MTARTEVEAPVDAPRRTRRRRRRDPVGAAVGVLGELMLTLGLLLGLFVVWQLGWTDVIAERTQAELIDEIEWLEPVEPAPDPAPEPAPTGEPPVMAEPEYLTTFAALYVPRWGSDYERVITQGVDKREILDVLGIGHYPGTAMPGDVGNFAVSGHRTTYGKPFNRVAELEIGDPLVVRTEDAWYVYRVTGTDVVLPHQVEVIAPVPNQPGVEPDGRYMTLTTCHPMFSARERFIVWAELDRWQTAASGAPAELGEV